jgi:hypothetical protein
VGQQDEWVTAAQARALVHVSAATIRTWTARNWIRAVRIGPRKTLSSRTDLLAMVRPVGKLTDAERTAIAELVADSPDPSDEQIAVVRSVIHAEAAAT